MSQSLAELWTLAESSASPTEKRDAWEKVWRAVESSDLISSNEEADDVDTSSLRYVLVPHYLAMACSEVVDERESQIKQCIRFSKLFMGLCDSLGLLRSSDRSRFERTDDGEIKPADL